MSIEAPVLEVERSTKGFEKDQTTILDLFAKQVEKNPDATAVLDERGQLTYLELDQQSNQLAHFLIDQGVKQKTIVGICVKSDCELLVGILGILKAGATYLPLDPSYPVDRLQLMLEDAQPPVLLTQSHLISRITSNQRLIISIKNSWKEKCSKYPKKLAPQLTINLKDLAYIIYTSGSVGQPKGIMVSHGSFLQTTAHKHHFQEGLIGLLLGAISFDVTILTIFYLLTTGGTICIPQAKTLAVLDSLIAFIKTQSINFILTVPSQYAKILEKSVPLHSLRIVSLAGESIPGHLPQLHAALAPQALL